MYEIGLRGRLVLLGGLVVILLIPLVAGGLGSGFTVANVTFLVAFTGYAGAIAWFVAQRHRQLRFGVLAGFLAIVALAIVADVIDIVSGTLPAGETAFSTLLELPFWVTVVGVPGAVCGGIGWYVARALATMSTPRHAH